MATTKTGADALGIYLTVETDATFTCDPDDSLGGFRDTTEVLPLYPLIGDDIPSIIIEKSLGANAPDTQGIIHAASATTLTYTAPSGTGPGAAVTVADGATVLLMEKAADGVDKGVRVRRDGSDTLGDSQPGGMTLDFQDSFENVIGISNITDAQRTAGRTSYRAIMFYAQGTENVTNLKVWQDAANSGIAIAKETLVSSAIQTIANETTAPTGRSWNTGTTSGAGVSIGSVNTGTAHGLWIRRIVGAGATATPKQTTILHFEFDAGGTTYTQRISGSFRIAQDALERFELHVGQDTDPDLTTAAEATSATLPFSYALTPGGGDIEFRFTVLKRNKYNVASLNQYWRAVTIDNAGAEVRGIPTGPEIISIVEGESGEIDISAKYSKTQDKFPADKFAVYVRGDGVNPTFAASERTLYDMNKSEAFNPATASLIQSIGPYAKRADVRVVVRTHRSTDTTESTNTTVTAITMSTLRPGIPDTQAFLGGTFRQKIDVTTSTTTTTIDSGANVRIEQSPGYTDFLHGATLLMRLRWDGQYDTNNGVWTTFGFSQSTVSGSSTEDPPYSWDGTSLFVHVGTTKRFRINTSTSLISCASLNQVEADSCLLRGDVDNPIARGSGWHSTFNVLDGCTREYVTALCLEDDGVLSMRVPWRQVAVVGDIP